MTLQKILWGALQNLRDIDFELKFNGKLLGVPTFFFRFSTFKQSERNPTLPHKLS